MKLYHRIFGEGPPLVILHGLYGSSDNWISVGRELSGSFTIILPDLRNHGKSGWEKTMSYPEMAADIVALIRELSPGKVFLAGHSMGGKVAALIALQYPELLQGLIILDISPFNNSSSASAVSEGHRAIIGCLSECERKRFIVRAEAEKYLKECTSSNSIGSFLAKNLQRGDNREFKIRMNLNSVKDNFEVIFSSALANHNNLPLPVTGFPVFFIKGSESPYLPKADYTGILHYFPGTEFIEIRDAGHWLHAEKRDEVCNHFRRLL